MDLLGIGLEVLANGDNDYLLWVDEERPAPSCVFTQDSDEAFKGAEDCTVDYNGPCETRFVRHVVLLFGVLSYLF
jgi:hypothetical protein